MFNFQSKKWVFCPIFSPLTNSVCVKNIFFLFHRHSDQHAQTTAPRLRSGTQCFGRMSVTFKVRRGRGQFSGLCSHPKRCSGTFSNCLSWNGADVLFVCLSLWPADTRDKKRPKKKEKEKATALCYLLSIQLFTPRSWCHTNISAADGCDERLPQTPQKATTGTFWLLVIRIVLRVKVGRVWEDHHRHHRPWVDLLSLVVVRERERKKKYWTDSSEVGRLVKEEFIHFSRGSKVEEDPGLQ